MRFHLNHTPEKPEFEIKHGEKLFLTGSCFSENIGWLLKEHKFTVINNPSGILFNPLSIYVQLNNSISNAKINPAQIIERGDEYFSYLHHSSVKAASTEALMNEINLATKLSYDFLKSANYLVITFGTAYYYQSKKLGTCVANCHKQPGNLFEKKLLSVNEIVETYTGLIAELQTLNPNLKIIFTVSPVKYLKDGVVENNISKSTLLLATHELVKNNSNCFYFPAFELVNDDLRDYRFYKEDLAHPNEQAINYVWEKFSYAFFSETTQKLNEKLKKLNTARNHRLLHNNTTEVEKFKKHIAELETEINEMQTGIL